MDPSHGPDMTLSIGSPVFITDIHGDVLKPRLNHIVSNNPTGLKRKRGIGVALLGTEVSCLSFEKDLGAPGGHDLGFCSSNSSPCNRKTSTGTVFMRGTLEEGPLMSLGLGLTELSSRGGFGSSCGTSLMPWMPTSVDMGMHHFAKVNSETGNGANVLLGLGPLHCDPISNNRKGCVRKGFSGADDDLIEKDLGMQLQLSLSNSSTVLSDDDRVSYMSLGQGSGNTYPDTRNGSVCVELNLVADDEGSTSARTLKTKGYIPSLLMGRMLDGAPLLETEVEEPDSTGQINFVHQVHSGELSLGYTNMARNLDNLLGNSLSGPSLTTDRTIKTCKFRGCGKGARDASGLCITHGGGRRCQRQGCNKGAEGRTVYCKSHGGGRRCQSLGCTKSAEGKTDYCIAHGGGRRCSHDGCTKAARGRSGLCIRHGGGKRCQREGCKKSAEGYSGLCISHGGGRRCQAEECNKGAQGSTMFCKAHGGGKRCMIQGCTKGAEGSTPLCKGHGGGKRCMFEGGGICTKSVHGGTSFCVAHGGGKRCAVEGCTKSARGRTSYCVKHGGGKRCKFEDCSKSAQGSTDFCKAHGGGKRCSWGQEGSPYMEFVNDKTGELLKGPCERFARGKLGLCAAHSALVQDRRVHGAETIGNALPAGIGPGLFRGLVNGLTVTDKDNHVVSVLNDASKQSTQESEACKEYGRFDSVKRGSANLNVRPCKDQVASVEDGLQRACSLPEAVGDDAAGLTIARSDLVITQNQCHSSSKISSGVMIATNGTVSGLIAGASLPNECEANHAFDMTGSFGSTNFLTAVKAPTVGNHYMGERRVLLPPQVLVPLSMQNGQFIPSGERGNMKHTRIDHAGQESGTSNASLLSMCEGRLHGGREERIHGGSILPLLGRK